MEIRIMALRLHNFKGVRQAEYIFGGRNARFEGPNGSGKSTVFDAFTWLLFGKDHKGQTAASFEIKTIDPATGKPFPREDHWVEAVLNVDGQDRVLRRSWIENWVKPTGSVEDVMKGHSTGFYVDGVDVGTQRAYDAVIGGWMKEDAFKLLTNPHYFIDENYTPWKDRRRALLDLVKDDPGRVRVREEFADVVEKLSGRSIEDYRKRLALEKAANKRDLAQVMGRIDGMRESLPAEQDDSAVTARLNELRAKRDAALAALKKEAEEIDGKIASADEADAARKAENAAIWAEITKVQLEMGNCITAATKAAVAKNTARNEEIVRARLNKANADASRGGAKAQAERSATELESMLTQRGGMAGDLAALGEKYKAIKAEAFQYTPDTRCPYCGQEIPAATVEQARDEAQKHFMASKKKAIDELIKSAGELKERIGQLDARIAGMDDIIAKAGKDYEAADADVHKWDAEIQRLEAQPAADVAAIEAQARASEEYRALVRKEQDLRAKALKTSSRPDDAVELVKQRKAVDERIRIETERYARAELEASNALSVGKVRAQQLELIKEKEKQAKIFADAMARDERDEARAAAFVKADIDSVEAALNGLFHTAKWKMFDRTIDGGIVEMCEVCDPDGTPYRSMNDAMKILCGIDVIRVFSERYGSVAPIFIDNAEGVLRDSFDTPAQVIRLVVKDLDNIYMRTE